MITLLLLWLAIATQIDADKEMEEAHKAWEKKEKLKKEREIENAKRSMEGVLISPFGQERVISVRLDRKSGKIRLYTPNGIYRISAESDFADKELFIRRYFDSFDPKLNCHSIRLDKELQKVFPQGWSVDARLIDGRRISFSSSDIDDIISNSEYVQGRIKSLEQSIARDEATIENRIDALTSEAQNKADELPDFLSASCLLPAALALTFFVLAFNLNHVWWTWFCFAVFCALCALCGIAAKRLYKRARATKAPQEKLDQDQILTKAKKELQAHRAELSELQGSVNASAGE